MKYIAMIACLFLWSCGTNGQAGKKNKVDKTPISVTIPEVKALVKSDAEWKAELTSQEYYVLREAGTERAFVGEYTDVTTDGLYMCAVCGNQLFSSNNKFHSGCGWPSFDDIENSDAVEYVLMKVME